MALSVIKNTNLVLTFFLEMGVLVALGYWGVSTGQGTTAKIALGLGAPAAAIVLWALFGAPKGKWHLKGFWRVLLQVVFFGSAAAALYVAVNPGVGVAWALICILILGLNYAWGQG